MVREGVWPSSNRWAAEYGSRLKAGTTTSKIVVLNPSSRPLPIGIAQAALEDLAGILARQVFQDFEVFRYFVIGERGFELGADRGDIQRQPGLRFHHCHQRLAELIVGDN